MGITKQFQVHSFYLYFLLVTFTRAPNINIVLFGKFDRQNSKICTLWYTALNNTLHLSVAKLVDTIRYLSYDCVTLYGKGAFANVLRILNSLLGDNQKGDHPGLAWSYPLSTLKGLEAAAYVLLPVLKEQNKNGGKGNVAGNSGCPLRAELG